MVSQNELRQQITDKIIEGLKAGKMPWRKPWSLDPNCGFPKNVVTKKSYQGINVLLLGLSDYQSRWWGTFNQWNQVGARIRKGEKASTAVLYKPVIKTDVNEAGEEEKHQFSLLKSFSLFNLEQVEGDLDHLRPAENSVSIGADYFKAQAVIDSTEADIRFGGNRACYVRPIGEWPNHAGGDFIECPAQQQFGNQEDFFSTLFHELCHWSEVRLGWKASYALNELVAEIGSCFLTAACGIPNSDDLTNHQSYVASWLEALENDKRAVFQAASQASKVAEFVLSFSGELAVEEAEVVLA